jgi:hypothetical protein
MAKKPQPIQEIKISEHMERLNRALAGDVPTFYFNGYVTHLGTGDILTILEKNGKPVAVLNMSYTMAKSFSASLGTMIAKLEETSGRNMLTTQDVEALAKELTKIENKKNGGKQ